MNFAATWSNAGPVNISDPANATITDAFSATLVSLSVSLASPQPGDVLSANTAGTNISASFVGGVLSLTGSDTVADYQQVLRTIQYDNTSGGPGVSTETISVVASDGVLTSAPADSEIAVHVASLLLLPDTQNPAHVDLVWDGTSGDDWVKFAQVNATTVSVTILEQDGVAMNNVQTFTGVTGRVVANEYDVPGDGDVVDGSGLTTIPSHGSPSATATTRLSAAGARTRLWRATATTRFTAMAQ